MSVAPPGGKKIWVLADDRAGNRSQCIGIADKLKLDYTVKEIRYNALVKLPNLLRGATLIGLDAKSKKKLKKGGWPDVVIAAGRRSAPVARFLKKKNPACKLVHLMWPDISPSEFDAIVLPTHDKAHGRIGEGKKAKDLPNILRILSAPHSITIPDLVNLAAEWEPKFALQPAPRIAVLVGGSTKHGEFTKGDFSKLGELAHKAAESFSGSLLITTSRRTGEEGEEALMAPLADTLHTLYSWRDVAEGKENPYMGYLAVADAIIVTADSISMCSEACSTGKAVYIFEPANLSAKHKRFVNTLIATGYAFPLTAEQVSQPRAPMKKEPLDSAATVAKFILDNYLFKTPA